MMPLALLAPFQGAGHPETFKFGHPVTPDWTKIYTATYDFDSTGWRSYRPDTVERVPSVVYEVHIPTRGSLKGHAFLLHLSYSPVEGGNSARTVFATYSARVQTNPPLSGTMAGIYDLQGRRIGQAGAQVTRDRLRLRVPLDSIAGFELFTASIYAGAGPDSAPRSQPDWRFAPRRKLFTNEVRGNNFFEAVPRRHPAHGR